MAAICRTRALYAAMRALHDAVEDARSLAPERVRLGIGVGIDLLEEINPDNLVLLVGDDEPVAPEPAR